MKVACLLLLATVACESNAPARDDARPVVDARWPVVSDASCAGACNHVAQTGCQQLEKCSAPFGGCGGSCVPDGAVPVGGTCAVDADGIDDCTGGHLCVDGVCERMCFPAPDSCHDDGQSCMAVEGLSEFYFVGVCRPPCDPLAQDCVAWDSDVHGRGCYVNLDSGETRCGPASGPDGDAPAGQGDACEFHFHCAVGYGCVLPATPDDPAGNVCSFFCDAEGAGGPTCANGPDASLTCVAINGGFYDSTPNVATNIGMCVDCTVWTEVPGCM